VGGLTGPGILATDVNDGHKLAIETPVTHACTPEKLVHIASRQLPTFKIGLSEFRHGLPSDETEFRALAPHNAAPMVAARSRVIAGVGAM
jgi:hypothetical protein